MKQRKSPSRSQKKSKKHRKRSSSRREQIIQQQNIVTKRPKLEETKSLETPLPRPALTRNRLAILIGILTLSGTLYFSLRGEESPEEPTKASIESSESDLFTAAVRVPNLDRNQIPALLKQKIAPFGKVVESPENYDSGKPNFFLLANIHFSNYASKNDPQFASDVDQIYQVQEELVQIFHQLYALGVNRQYLEGVHANMNVEHNVVYQGMESPAQALPEYMETGRINRSTRAIEGIYQDQLSTIGAEQNIANLRQIKANFDYADQYSYKKAWYDIFDVLAERLNIPEGTRLNAKTIWSHVKDDPALREALIEEVVLTNQDFLDYLEAHTNWAYTRTKGRNLAYAEIIKTNTLDDSAFIIGANHIEHLKTLPVFNAYNLFVIQPNSDQDNHLDRGYDEIKTKEDYRQNILHHDLWRFGLVAEDVAINVTDE